MKTNHKKLEIYLKKFTHLRQGVTKYGKAPHKPILILSLIELFEKSEATDNKIFITPELVGNFKENFALLVRTEHKADFFQPFYYLRTEGFWDIKTKPGKELVSFIRSFNVLNDVVEYGYLSPDLYELLLKQENQNILKTALLDHYFPETKAAYLKAKKGGGYIQDLQKYLLNESAASYNIELLVPDEEQQFIRGGLFKKLVPQVYNHTCCISGMRLISNHGFSMVDACHITPFSIFKDDRVTNGLALCPNLHRAFDRGLISVDEQLRVLVSPSIAEDAANVYALQHLEGKRLQLPFGEIHFPAATNLAWHRENVFKG